MPVSGGKLLRRSGSFVCLETNLMKTKTLLAGLFAVIGLAASAAAAEGLTGGYYSGYSVVNNRIVFEALPLVSTQTNTQFDLWNGTQFYDWNPIGNISYSVRWTGYLHVTESGLHGFGTISDDGSEIWIDGRRIVDNHEQQWYDWQEGYCHLGAGYHSIEITFYEALSFSGIEVWWLPPSAAPSVLPYSGETFHSVPPTFNTGTRWEILPAAVLCTEAPFVNPWLIARHGPVPGQVELTWNSFTNVNYFIESSTNLVHWQDMTGVLPGISGVMTQAVNKTSFRQFFRARLE
jgi:hypothetical protein